MRNQWVFLMIGLCLGAGFGLLAAVTTGAQLEQSHDHSAHAEDHETMDHDTPTPAAPGTTVALQVHPDGPNSRNIEIMTDGFTFAPEAVNGPPVPGQGHAHVYVNGIKYMRAYGPFQHLDHLPSGEVTLTITLNANDHSPLALDGAPLMATQTITVD